MKQKVAIQGIKASFHNEAAKQFFKDDISILECTTFKKTCEALHSNNADFAVMAIENAIAGALLPNYNLIRDFNLRVVGEIYLPIELHLMGLKGVKLDDAKHITSHPIAIRQCHEYLDNLPESIEITEKFDTAGCAKLIQTNKLSDTLAIANERAAKLYDLEIIEANIQSNKRNFTRFLILQKEESYQPIEANKATISFQVGSGVGSLASVLRIFADNNINLTKIQSTPVLGKPHKDNFFVDMIWSQQSDFDSALSLITRHVYNLTILGEYKQDENFNRIKASL